VDDIQPFNGRFAGGFMEKDCCFQLYIDGKITDSGPITKEEGLMLLMEHKQQFVDACIRGKLAEMALWINMADESSFRETHVHIHSDDMIVRDGELYEQVRVAF